MARPQLSIGIIFKNEARCLERCLKSFQALREAVPCEIVMADTGSTDGSHEIAAKYADILFDFPWINDFSAARNAVMDRSSGKWYLTVDADEWLDEDISELVGFLKSIKKRPERVCTVIQRNYFSERFEPDNCNDLMAMRMVRMASKLRYVAPIHECFPIASDQEPTVYLNRTILHHDGYIGMGDERGRAKRERNLMLLRQQMLDENSENIRTLVEYIDSGTAEEDFLDRIYETVKAVQEKKQSWVQYGPPALRQAVCAACERSLPELQEWAAMAEEMFPASFFVCLDIAYTMSNQCWEHKEYEECLRWCEKYERAITDFRSGQGEMKGLLFSTLRFATAGCENVMKNRHIAALYRCGKCEEADNRLNKIDCSIMDNNQFKTHVRTLIELQAKGPVEELYHQISAPEYPEGRAEEHRSIFFQEAAATFASDYRKKEAGAENFTQHAYTLFASLNGKCEIGTAAAVMQADGVQEIETLLGMIEDWDYLPTAALEHALEKGIHFPPAGKLMSLEEMDKLAARLGRNVQLTAELTLRAAGSLPEDLASLLWARGVAIVAVRSCHWQEAEQGMALCRAFAKVVGSFVSRYYAEEAFRGDNFQMLPGMYRAAWYCQKAFEALDGGDFGAYVRLLREGVTAYPGTKKMAMFLLDNTPEVQELLVPPPEVQALADQVRVILARYEPNDPAVAALKQSEAYQKVAHLINSCPPAHKRPRNNFKIFTFWEPRKSIPAYLQACMQTWKKFLPHAEIHVLDYSNMADYVDAKAVYGERLFSGSFTLSMIADAVRALVLERHGGIWMDADTILTEREIKEYFCHKKEVSFFGYPAQSSVHLAWISAEKHAKLLQHWVSQCAKKINSLTKTDMEAPNFWSYLGNSITNPYIQSHPNEIEIKDVIKAGCTPELKFSSPSPLQAYIDFYFKKSLHLQDINSPVLLLHNSWTPPEYRMLPLDQLSQCDCTMSNILMELTQ